MDIVTGHHGREDAVISLFEETFTASEGADEGATIAQFVRALIATTPDADLRCFLAYENDALTGGVFFSRLTYDNPDRTVFILSPMAVRTDQQKRGIGQRLIGRALENLRAQGVDTVMTYGDINFYAKVGFEQIAQQLARAPLALSYPEGWLALSLEGGKIRPLSGTPTCVSALNDPALW